ARRAGLPAVRRGPRYAPSTKAKRHRHRGAGTNVLRSPVRESRGVNETPGGGDSSCQYRLIDLDRANGAARACRWSLRHATPVAIARRARRAETLRSRESVDRRTTRRGTREGHAPERAVDPLRPIRYSRAAAQA